jgi:hypothetical protein
MNTALTVKNKIGLGIAIVLGIADLAGLALIGQQDSGDNGPPAGVLIFSAVMGVATLVGVGIVFAKKARSAARVVAISRVLSMITSLPAFFVGGVPAGLIAVVAISVIVTIVCVALVISKPKTSLVGAQLDPA